jgi:hypothetical protein
MVILFQNCKNLNEGANCGDIDPPFLASSMVYNHFKVHNILAIMLDFHYKK